MKEHFSEQLESLRRQLITMGAQAESQIARAIEALVDGDALKARAVIEGDKAIDQLEIKIDEDAIDLLATQQPVAGDLRLLVSALKINADLERIGDHATNIAEAAERMAKTRPFKPLIDIPYMAEIARGMLQDSLDAFVRRDAVLALEVCKRADMLDEKNKSIIRQLLTYDRTRRSSPPARHRCRRTPASAAHVSAERSTSRRAIIRLWGRPSGARRPDLTCRRATGSLAAGTYAICHAGRRRPGVGGRDHRP